jgi:PAS domain S-box-containing protein
MHYVGIAAMRAPVVFHWNARYVCASILIAVAAGACAFPIQAIRQGLIPRILATALLVLAICGLHFIAMAGLTLEYDPAAAIPPAGTAPEMLAVAVAGVTAVIIAIALVSAVIDGRFARTAASQKELLDLALNTMRHGLVMFDKDHKVVLLNRSYIEMYRLSPERIKPDHTLRDLLEQRTAAGTFDGDIDEYIERHRVIGRATDTVARTPHGLWIHIVNHLIADGGWVSLHHDVTKRVLAEEERDRSRQFLDQVIENVPVTIFAKDVKSGRIVFVNRAAEALWGAERSQILGKTAAEIVGSDMAERIASSDRSVLESGEAAVSHEEDLQTPFGLRRMISRRIVIHDPAGQPQYLLGVDEDVTERRALEQQLLQAHKMEAIGNLTGGMAHDFNNLLGVIIGNLDMVQPSAPNSENAILVSEAMEAALHGAELTRSLLAYARRQPLQPERIVPNDLLAGLVRLLSRTLGENIRISLDLAPDLSPIEVDPSQLEACIVNLATNARDAMPSGGRLGIATMNLRADATYLAAYPDVASGDYAVLEVTDSGCGMTPHVLKQIFEPFFTTKEVGKGTGLGLSMVFGFIRQSGGFVTVYSEPGVGTTFRLHLPSCIEAGEADRGIAPEASRPAQGETILVVEDNAAMRRIVVRQLHELGYSVLEAESAADAIGMIERTRVDLVFSDVVMPGEMDGLGLARHVLTRQPDAAVLLTSGFPEKKFEDRFKGMASSVRLLGKPYRKEQLAAAVRDALGQKHLTLVEA